MSIERGNYSPNYAIGMIHGAYDTARPPGTRRYYHPAYAHMWTYRRGFARAARLARGLQPIPRTAALQPRRHDHATGRRCWCWAVHTPTAKPNGTP